jgi:hypothetical protein
MNLKGEIMKKLGVFLLLLMLFPSVALGGEIFGTITEEGRSIGQGTKVEIVSSGNTYSAETDKFGSYRIYVKETGRCVLKVQHGGQTPSIEISSYESSVRYDLALEKKDGQYSLKRR